MRDTVTKECFRADHLLKGRLANTACSGPTSPLILQSDKLDVLSAESKDDAKKAELAHVRAQIDELDDKELHAAMQKYGGTCSVPSSSRCYSRRTPLTVPPHLQ